MRSSACERNMQWFVLGSVRSWWTHALASDRSWGSERRWTSPVWWQCGCAATKLATVTSSHDLSSANVSFWLQAPEGYVFDAECRELLRSCRLCKPMWAFAALPRCCHQAFLADIQRLCSGSVDCMKLADSLLAELLRAAKSKAG